MANNYSDLQTPAKRAAALKYYRRILRMAGSMTLSGSRSPSSPNATKQASLLKEIRDLGSALGIKPELRNK